MTRFVEKTFAPQKFWQLGRYKILYSGPESRAWYNPWTDRIIIDSNLQPEERERVLRHERQHARDRRQIVQSAMVGFAGACLMALWMIYPAVAFAVNVEPNLTVFGWCFLLVFPGTFVAMGSMALLGRIEKRARVAEKTCSQANQTSEGKP